MPLSLFFFSFVIPFYCVISSCKSPPSSKSSSFFFLAMYTSAYVQVCLYSWCVLALLPLILCIGVYRASQFLIRFFNNFPLAGFFLRVLWHRKRDKSLRYLKHFGTWKKIVLVPQTQSMFKLKHESLLGTRKREIMANTAKKKVEGNLVEFLLFCGSTKKISQKIQEVKRKFSSHLRFPVDTIELECDIYIVRYTFFGQHIHPTFSSYFTY